MTLVDALVIYALTFGAMQKLAPTLAERVGLLGRWHPLLVPPSPPVHAEGQWWVVYGRIDHPDSIRASGLTAVDAVRAARAAWEGSVRERGPWLVWLSKLLACAYCTGFHAGWGWRAVTNPVDLPSLGVWGGIMLVGAVLTAHPWRARIWLTLWVVLLAAAGVACVMLPEVLSLAAWGLSGAALAYGVDAGIQAAEARSGGADGGALAAQVQELSAQVDAIDDGLDRVEGFLNLNDEGD